MLSIPEIISILELQNAERKSLSKLLKEAKKNYRRLALKYHPDRGGDAEKFKQLVQAWDLIQNKYVQKELSSWVPPKLKHTVFEQFRSFLSSLVGRSVGIDEFEVLAQTQQEYKWLDEWRKMAARIGYIDVRENTLRGIWFPSKLSMRDFHMAYSLMSGDVRSQRYAEQLYQYGI